MSDPDPSTPSTPFWRFSLHVYRQPGVAEACIALQDGCGVDVNVLLFVMWLAATQRRLSQDDVQALEDAVRGWRNMAVIPLRDLRRALKDQPTVVGSGRQEAFRNRIKAVELEAERLQQEALYASARDGRPGVPSAPPAAVGPNIAAYERVLGVTFPNHAIDTLIAVFTAVDHGAFAA